MLTASLDGCICEWDTDVPYELSSYSPHRQPQCQQWMLQTPSMSPLGLGSGMYRDQDMEPQLSLTCVACEPDGRIIAACEDGTILYYMLE